MIAMNDDFGQFHRGLMPLPPMDLMSVLFEDMRSHESGDVAPDTAGADFFFIQYFMTDDMYWDFDRIEEQVFYGSAWCMKVKSPHLIPLQ